jgi:hypothetical protein
MMMTPRVRKAALFAHATSSVGWIGAVAVFLVVAVIGMTSDDAQTVRGVYLVMEPAAWRVLLPLAIASLVSGLVMSLGTAWGLFRYYWVIFKLAISVFATIILLIYMGTFRLMAGVADNSASDLDAIRNPSPVLHATLAMLLLLAANVLAVYKPLGFTAYGLRAQRESGRAQRPTGLEPAVRWDRYALAAIIGLFVLVVLWHLAGGGLHGLHGN